MGSYTLELGEICGELVEEPLDGPRSTAERLRTLFEIERVRLDPPAMGLVGAPIRNPRGLCGVDVLLVNPARRLAAATSPLMPESFYQRRMRLLLEIGRGLKSTRCTLFEIAPLSSDPGSVDEHLRTFLSSRLGLGAAWREFSSRAEMIGIHGSLHERTFHLLLEAAERAVLDHLTRYWRMEVGHGRE